MTSKIFAVLVAVAALAVMPVMAQTAPEHSVWDVIKDPGNVAAVGFIAANLADASTDWHFTGPITRKEYTITPAQRVGLAGGGTMAALAVKYFWPRSGKIVDGVLGVATAYLAGRALANAYNHGAPQSTAPAAAVAMSRARGWGFAVRVH